MSTFGLNDKILCYLSVKAQSYVDHLVRAGLDRDLAVTFLEQLMPEDEMYELPDDEPPSSSGAV
jgi:hypothetical protein